MASFTNRGENRWLVRIFLGRDAKGKQLVESHVVRGNKKAAQAWARKRETEIELGITPAANEPAKSYTLRDAITTWLNTKKLTVSARTILDYDSVPRLYLDELADTAIADIEADALTDLFTALRDRGLSSRILRRVHLVLRAAFNLAHRRGLLTINPMADIPAAKYERQVKICFMTAEQARDFLKAADGSKYATLWHLALETGLRPEEYLALGWSALDLQRHILSVERVIIYDDDGWKFSTKLKTKNAKRKIAISAQLAARLKQQRAEVDALEQSAKIAFVHDLVFPNTVGDPLDQNNLRNRFFKPLIKAAKLDAKTRPYDLRHTAATLLLASGVNLKVVSMRMGHSSVAFTLDVYGHVLPYQQDEATKTFAGVLYAKAYSGKKIRSNNRKQLFSGFPVQQKVQQQDHSTLSKRTKRRKKLYSKAETLP